MPGYPGKINTTNRKPWMSRQVVNPWENGIAPGLASSISSFGSSGSSSYLLSRTNDFRTATFSAYGNPPNKMRRLDGVGSFEENRGRGLLPSPPGSSLLGNAPPNLPPIRGAELLQHRLGPSWQQPVRTGTMRGAGYYPQDINARRFIKPRRPFNPNNKPSNQNKSNTKDKAKSEAPKKATSPSKPKAESDAKDGDDSSVQSESVEKDVKEGDQQEKEENEEEKKDDSAKTKEKEKPIDDYPADALYCHICDLDNFTSRKGYIRHLEGTTHARMSELFHSKNAALLELLNVSAKLAEMRQRDKLLRKTGKKGQPYGKSIEQEHLHSFLRTSTCCGSKFRSRYELEEHKLTFPHLKKVYEASQEKQLATEVKCVTDVVQHEEAKKLLQEALSNPLTINTMPMYEANSAIGLEFLEENLYYICKVCRNAEDITNFEIHCTSHEHYDNIMTHFNKQKAKEEEEERKKKEEEEKMEEEKKEEKKEKKNGTKEVKEGVTEADEDGVTEDMMVYYSDEELNLEDKSIQEELETALEEEEEGQEEQEEEEQEEQEEEQEEQEEEKKDEEGEMEVDKTGEEEERSEEDEVMEVSKDATPPKANLVSEDGVGMRRTPRRSTRSRK